MGVLDNLAALKGGYELGQAVFGQDEASRKQALMEKQLGLESALRVKQLEDEQAYRQGALANDWERNRIAEDQNLRANKLGWGQVAAQERGQDVHQNIANLQNLTTQRGQDITSRHYDTQAGLQQKELELRRLVADGTISYQQAQVELEREKNRISKQTADQMGGYYASMGRVNDARTAALDDELGRRRAFDKRRGNIFKALSDPAGPWAIPEGPERDEVLTALASGQPGALADIKMVGSAPADGKATPEALAAAQRLTQSYVDRNVGAKDAEGNVVVPGGRLNSFQPFGDGSKDIMMMLEVRKRRPDGTEFTEVKPLTEGRTAVDQGGMPLRLKPQDIGMWAMGMKSLGEWGANNSEGQQYVDDMRAAYAESGDEEAFNKNLYQRQRTRAMEAKQESRLKEIDEKALVSARQVAAQKAERILNQLAPQKANEEGGKVSPEDQQAMQTKLQIMKTIREDIMGRDLNDLHTRSVEQYFEIPAIKSQLERLNNGGAFVPSPETGKLQNPRAAGGQPGPLSQAAPNQGGGFFPASYQPRSLGMPKNLQITGTARHFGTEKVDPSLMEGVKAAATLWPGTVDLFSSGRAKTKRERGNHSSWKALDVGLITPEGKYLPNHINKKWHGGGSGAAHEYERFWQAAVLWAAQDDPTILDRFRWGGNFREQDYMHGDTLRGVGGKSTGAGTLFGGRDTRYGGGKTYPVKDLNALGRQLYGDRWRGIPGLARMA